MGIELCPLVSIIIPIYNVEPFLRECLDSVVNQTLRTIEIICVNDCSSDRSLDILQEYADKDKRIKVVDKKINEGLSTTRNIGMSFATGKYLLFVDSDDYVDHDLCRKAFECAEKNRAGLVIYDFAVFHNAQNLEENRKKVSALANLDPSDRVALLKSPAFAWTKLIRTDLAHKLDLKFPPGLTYEDLPVHWKLMTLATKIAILPERLCYYRQRNSSITYRSDWSLTDRILILDSVRDFLVSRHLYGIYQDLFLQSQLDVYCWLHEHIAESHKQKAMALIEDRLGSEHWDYIESQKPLSWKTRAFYQAIRGSTLAKVRRSLWFFARDCYRGLNRQA